MPAIRTRTRPAYQPRRPRPSTPLSAWIVLIGGLASIVCCLGIAALGPDSPAPSGPGRPAAPGGGSKSEAWIMAKEFVTDHLKAPSTAEFPWSGETVRKGDQWYVKGYVDSQNSFGAMLRSDWGCVLEKHGDQWKCRYLKIGDQVLIVN